MTLSTPPWSGPPVSPKEQVLVEMAQWIARILQYSVNHPSCAPLALRTHQVLTRALNLEAPLEYGILKDDVLLGEDHAVHRATKTRMAPFLHERGVLLLRFAYGVTEEELGKFVALVARTPQNIFEAGGLLRLAVDAGVSRITLEEIAHDITDEEREEHRRRKRMRAFFSDMLKKMLANRGLGLLVGDQLVELLSHPDVAVRILEDDVQGVAEAVACLALLVRQEEGRGRPGLRAQFVKVLSMLSPESRDKVVLGFPPLVGDFRLALVWAIDGFTEDELARFTFPSLRAHAEDLEPVLYSMSVLVPHDGTRLSCFRILALYLFDLPADEPRVAEMLGRLAAPVPEYDSFRRERECLAGPAGEALRSREALPATAPTGASNEPPPPRADGDAYSFDARASVFELVKMAGRMRDFDAVAPKLLAAAGDLATSGASDVVIGIVRGLRGVATPEWKTLAETTLRDAVTPELVGRVLLDIDRASSKLEGPELDEMVEVIKVFSTLRPTEVFERLERSDSRKMRRILLEALPLAGSALLPLLRRRLTGVPWFVARNAVLLLPKAGGAPKDLTPVARNPNEKVRLEIVRALRAMTPDAFTMEILAPYLVDESSEIAQGARATLKGELLGPAAIAELARLADDDKGSDDLRRHCIRLLGQCPDDAAATALFKILQPKGLLELGSGSSGLRDYAALALHVSPAPAAKALFKQGLSSSVWRVRKACERAAGGGS